MRFEYAFDYNLEFCTDLVFSNLQENSKVGQVIASTGDFIIDYFHQRASFVGPRTVQFSPAKLRK